MRQARRQVEGCAVLAALAKHVQRCCVYNLLTSALVVGAELLEPDIRNARSLPACMGSHATRYGCVGVKGGGQGERRGEGEEAVQILNVKFRF